MRRTSLILIALMFIPALAGAITLGQVDDFQDATLQGWRSGGANPNPPVAAADAGPDGAGDWAMVATADGAGAGGAVVVFNTAQWAGDYLTAGVNAIAMDLSNLGATDLVIRAVLRGGGQTFATTQAAVLPGGDPTFRRIALSLLPADLTGIGGSSDVLGTLGAVTEVRLLHAVDPAGIGDPVVAQLAVDNVTALADTVLCSPGLLEKVDAPADLLWLPGFEVDTNDPAGRTTLVTVHNQTDEPRVARFQYFDADSNLQVSEDAALAPRQTQPIDVRRVDGLAVDPDGVARGWAQILACAEGGGELASSFTGDYLFLDSAGDFATGDQLLRVEDLCARLQVRLVNFGSGVTVRLYASDPQGELEPTAGFAVHDEDGNLTDSGALLIGQPVSIFDSSVLTDTQFGILDVELFAGGGSISVEYSAFGRFSVSMNGNCVEPLAQ